MTKRQIELAYAALLQNDGNSMCPGLPWDQRVEISLALDRLRSELAERLKPGWRCL